MKKSIQRRTPKFTYLRKVFGQKPFTLLDIGAGNHSASKTKMLFPQCAYYGVDLSKHYNNDEADFKAMEAFYELDLTLLDYHEIPDNYFDFIRMTHIIEHLHNGDEVIELLCTKLKSGGYIYVEYPGIKSTKLPSMRNSLNFYDDPTHVRLYSVPELTTLMEQLGFDVIAKGTRRNIPFILATPFKVIAALFSGKKIEGSTFWDLLGFAEYVFARKR